jgi:hypothetical protein
VTNRLSYGAAMKKNITEAAIIFFCFKQAFFIKNISKFAHNYLLTVCALPKAL